MMENQTALIRGKRIVAMNADSTSVAHMLHLLGVEPTSELVAEYVLENTELDMLHLHAFLVKKGIMSDVEGAVADLRDVQLIGAPADQGFEATAEVQEPIPPESAGPEPAAEPAAE